MEYQINSHIAKFCCLFYHNFALYRRKQQQTLFGIKLKQQHTWLGFKLVNVSFTLSA